MAIYETQISGSQFRSSCDP